MKHYKAIAEYYDAEYAEKRMLQQDVPFLLKQLPKKRQAILELAVGTARAAIPLAQAGHRVVGVDYDPAVLEIARRKRDAVGLREKELSLVHQDALELDLPQRFDWAVILFNTFLGFTTLDQQDRLLHRVRKHLKPRGRLWIDVFHPNMALLAPEESHDVDTTVFHVPRYDRTVTRTADVRRHDPNRQVQRITFKYTWFDGSGNRREEKRVFDLTYMFPRELTILLERNGYGVERVFGDYAGRPLRRDSERIIVQSRSAASLRETMSGRRPE